MLKKNVNFFGKISLNSLTTNNRTTRMTCFRTNTLRTKHLDRQVVLGSLT